MRCLLLLVAAAAELRSGLVAPSCPRRHLKRTLRCDVEAPERPVWRRLAAKVGRAARRGYDPRLLRKAACRAMGRRSIYRSIVAHVVAYISLYHCISHHPHVVFNQHRALKPL